MNGYETCPARMNGYESCPAITFLLMFVLQSVDILLFFFLIWIPTRTQNVPYHFTTSKSPSPPFHAKIDYWRVNRNEMVY